MTRVRVVPVLTYESPRGGRVNITPEQRAWLESCGVWPKDEFGEEYAFCMVGEHDGIPTWNEAEFAARFGGAS